MANARHVCLFIKQYIVLSISIYLIYRKVTPKSIHNKTTDRKTQFKLKSPKPKEARKSDDIQDQTDTRFTKLQKNFADWPVESCWFRIDSDLHMFESGNRISQSKNANQRWNMKHLAHGSISNVSLNSVMVMRITLNVNIST